MANLRRDPTGNWAAGAIDKEISRKEAEIKRAAAELLSGRLSRAEERALMGRFHGIYRGILQYEIGRLLDEEERSGNPDGSMDRAA